MLSKSKGYLTGIQSKLINLIISNIRKKSQRENLKQMWE
jgi:hypothetical protein